ncbi:cellulase family glycosylhydrolase [Polaribacter aestuariivivens]|uniref:cellulase family glycosylhydrolase n=1 Tax=Polaribacter aestuariivivens TaxID=2304626 RepID=UPI003F49A4C7
MVNKNKAIIRGVLILSYVFIISIILFLVSSLLNYLNTGADRSKMLHTEIKKEAQYLPKITWKKNGNEGRYLDKQTLNEIENDYLDAWYIKQVAYKTNLKSGIKDYYTDNARKNLLNNIAFNKKEGISVVGTTLNHNPDILFFSEDGQLIVLEDKNVIEYKKIIKNSKLVLETTEKSIYKVILLLEDGFWRIRHLVKENTIDYDKTVNNTPIIDENIKGINYYPQKTPWDLFGDEFDETVIKKDFDIIKNAELNTIRIFIQYEDFGKANVKEEKLQKLQQVLDLAEKSNLKVIVTLFDFYGNYDVLDWTLNHRHVEKIVSKFKDHNAILAWDLKNEPNLDFDSRGKETVIAWLEHLVIFIKSIDTKHSVTIGWSNAESAAILKDKVDFVSFHYYEDISKLEKEYLNLKDKITDKPIFLGEFGVSSYDGFWKPLGSSEEKQATYYKEIQKVLTKNKIPYLSWTLYDFEKVPNSVVGKLPWRVNPQKEFGFINIKGEKKPAFKYISK